jgi:predicted SprT family Zn-dependent metalloprotease
MTTVDAIIQCRVLLAKNNVFDWQVKICDRSKRTLGLCDYRKKEIRLGRWMFQHLSDDEIVDTIRHEVAHVLAGDRAGHGYVWRQYARQLGAKPEQYFHGKVDHYSWETFCVTCGKVSKRNFNRRSDKVLSKRRSGCCSGPLDQRQIE